MFEDRFYFRGKDEHSVLAIPVERFHAIAVARQKQSLLFSIEDRKSKHPVKVIDALLAPFFISVNDDFGVGARVKVIAQRFQLDAQFGKVVDLAVVSDDYVTVAAGHRLMTRGRKIDDGQTSVAETDRPVGVIAFAVRPTVTEATGHALQQAGRHGIAL